MIFQGKPFDILLLGRDLFLINKLKISYSDGVDNSIIEEQEFLDCKIVENILYPIVKNLGDMIMSVTHIIIGNHKMNFDYIMHERLGSDELYFAQEIVDAMSLSIKSSFDGILERPLFDNMTFEIDSCKLDLSGLLSVA